MNFREYLEEGSQEFADKLIGLQRKTANEYLDYLQMRLESVAGLKNLKFPSSNETSKMDPVNFQKIRFTFEYRDCQGSADLAPNGYAIRCKLSKAREEETLPASKSLAAFVKNLDRAAAKLG